MLKKLTHIIVSTFAIVCLPCSAFADYFPWLTINSFSLTSSGGTVSLSDGSEWSIDSLNAPNIEHACENGGAVWILPIYQAGSPQPNVCATLFLTGWTASMATLKTGSSTLEITSVNSQVGTVTLSDGTSWTLDSHFHKYYTTWQVGDPITLAGHQYQYFLINGTDRPSEQTFSIATQIQQKS